VKIIDLVDVVEEKLTSQPAPQIDIDKLNSLLVELTGEATAKLVFAAAPVFSPPPAAKPEAGVNTDDLAALLVELEAKPPTVSELTTPAAVAVSEKAVVKAYAEAVLAALSPTIEHLVREMVPGLVAELVEREIEAIKQQAAQDVVE
jgi:hypothetical protein